MTIKEIAKLAGVSPATVSRVINNSGYVKDEVRKRVQKVIDETGYRPNPFAKALHQNKSQTIGVILPKINASSSGDTVAGINDYFSESIRFTAASIIDRAASSISLRAARRCLINSAGNRDRILCRHSPFAS